MSTIDHEMLTQKKRDIYYKIKGANFEHKELDSQARTVKMVVNTLNFFDYDFDSLSPGVANRSIANNGAKSSAPDKIAHLLHHDIYRPVGKSTHEAQEVIDGRHVLYCESFLPETIDGDDTLTKYEAGMFNQHSIGFQYKVLEYLEKGAAGWDKWLNTLINPEDADAVGYGWNVKEIRWYEYSTVVFGANKLTTYLGSKSANKIDHVEALNAKIAILATKAMRREIKNQELFKFELLQLQQMVCELFDTGSSDDGATKDTQLPGVGLSGFSNKLILFNK